MALLNTFSLMVLVFLSKLINRKPKWKQTKSLVRWYLPIDGAVTAPFCQGSAKRKSFLEGTNWSSLDKSIYRVDTAPVYNSSSILCLWADVNMKDLNNWIYALLVNFNKIANFSHLIFKCSFVPNGKQTFCWKTEVPRPHFLWPSLQCSECKSNLSQFRLAKHCLLLIDWPRVHNVLHRSFKIFKTTAAKLMLANEGLSVSIECEHSVLTNNFFVIPIILDVFHFPIQLWINWFKQ